MNIDNTNSMCRLKYTYTNEKPIIEKFYERYAWIIFMIIGVMVLVGAILHTSRCFKSSAGRLGTFNEKQGL
jgi:hypothetical protein